jgi:Trypsin-like peptidase domain
MRKKALNPITGVIAVGEGRGFVVEGLRDRLIVTAGHCLPTLPPCMSASYTEERTYERILGKLGQEQNVWAECLFVEPVSDIAVLGAPDSQDLYNECSKYQALVDELTPLPISDFPAEASARLLSLENQWFGCKVRHIGRALWIFDAATGIVGGMSGSPIIDDDGRAIGVLCTSASGPNEKHTEGGPNPRLVANLPGWLLNEVLLPRGRRR